MKFETVDKMCAATLAFVEELKKVKALMEGAHDQFHERLQEVLDNDDDLDHEIIPQAILPCAIHQMSAGMIDAAIKDLEVKVMKSRIEWKKNNDPKSITAAELREFAEVVLGMVKEKPKTDPLPSTHMTDWGSILRGKQN